MTGADGLFGELFVDAEMVSIFDDRACLQGMLDFEAALDARVALLEGLAESDIERCLAERVTIMPGAQALVRTMRARGAMTLLVSGGFTAFAEPVADMLGFERVEGVHGPRRLVVVLAP